MQDVNNRRKLWGESYMGLNVLSPQYFHKLKTAPKAKVF